MTFVKNTPLLNEAMESFLANLEAERTKEAGRQQQLQLENEVVLEQVLEEAYQWFEYRLNIVLPDEVELKISEFKKVAWRRWQFRMEVIVGECSQGSSAFLKNYCEFTHGTGFRVLDYGPSGYLDGQIWQGVHQLSDPHLFSDFIAAFVFASKGVK